MSDECHEETGQCNCRPGIDGRDCSECSRDRFILTQQGCTTCDDGCTGVLLDEVTLLDKRLQEGAGHLFGGVIPPPWPQLQATNNTAIKLKYWLDLAKRVAVLPDDISDKLKWQARQLLDKSHRLESRGKQLEKDGQSIREAANKLSKEISALQEEIYDVVRRLTHYGQADTGGIVSVSQALQEAHQLLHKIKGTNLNQHSKAANHSLKFCADLLNFIQNMLHGLVKYEGLQQQLNNLDERLNDLNNLISETVNKSNKASEISSKNEEALTAVRNSLKRIEAQESEQRAFYAEGENFNKESQQLLNVSASNIQNFEALAKNLTDLISAVEKIGRAHV